MESENGVPLEDEKKVVIVEKSSAEGPTADMNTSCSHEPFPVEENEVCKDIAENKEGLKTSNLVKEPDASGSKIKKFVKNQYGSKGSVAFGRSTKPSLTQSLSFPVRGRHSDVPKRSIELYPVELEAKQPQKNGSRVGSQVSNGSISSSPRTNPTSKGTLSVSNSKKVTGAGPTVSRRATLPSSTRTTSEPAPNVVVQRDSEPSENSFPVKEEEDARSTTSSTQQRINVSAFSFRLQERAERRKEFFSKIEEKIHAKEVEKSNLQAKSKENQEAEIKQLRKSLTFKATPIPSFYKEPPPKVELKKIPTTRAISPKLGRNKGAATTVSNLQENGGSILSPRVTKDNCKSPKAPQANGDKTNIASKKFTKSSLSKPRIRETSTAKKVKHVETEGQEKPSPAMTSEQTHDGPEKNLTSSNSEVLPCETAAEG